MEKTLGAGWEFLKTETISLGSLGWGTMGHNKTAGRAEFSVSGIRTWLALGSASLM